MNNFYVTFGQKYHHEEHPAGGHPDGWFLVRAENEGDARKAVFNLMGDKWAFMYSEERFNKSFFPKGCLKSIDASTDGNLTNGGDN